MAKPNYTVSTSAQRELKEEQATGKKKRQKNCARIPREFHPTRPIRTPINEQKAMDQQESSKEKTGNSSHAGKTRGQGKKAKSKKIERGCCPLFLWVKLIGPLTQLTSEHRWDQQINGRAYHRNRKESNGQKRLTQNQGGNSKVRLVKSSLPPIRPAFGPIWQPGVCEV